MIGFYKPKDKYGEFSNWYMTEFTLDGITYKNSEQAFMYKKALLFNDIDIARKILNNANPMICKNLGRAVKNFDPKIFDENKYKFMLEVNLAKYSQNDMLKNLLLSTGEEVLCEATPKDKIWGIGLDINEPNFSNMETWPGQNLLGKVLMEVREKLKKEAK